MGQTDDLRGSLEALSWGQTPSVGTGCHFDILCNVKVEIVPDPYVHVFFPSTVDKSTFHVEGCITPSL